MIFIGVTGGIGSGKSTVCSQFEQKGIPVFYADAVAKVLADGEALNEIVSEFGPEVLTSANVLDRKKLGNIVFNDPSKLDRLNSIIHPRVFHAFEQWKSILPAATKYALVEAALMFESGMFELMHYVLAVLADEQIRIERVVSRDSVTEEQVKARIKNQISLEQLLELSDFQINNNSALSDLTPKINFFHTIFSNLQPPKEIE
ncbi:MAG: dephospho-CoA kinase [Bacteroidetes bacterium]|nr:dephospho-CoA kinase [Bacteroidota bacterium]